MFTIRNIFYLHIKHFFPICLLLFGFTLASKVKIVHAAIEQPINSAILLSTGTPTETVTQTTPEHTATPSAVPSDTPTTTLLPLPAYTLIFPASTSTSSPTISPEPIPSTKTPTPSVGSDIVKHSPRISILFVLIIILWVFLAGFVIVFLRQFR